MKVSIVIPIEMVTMEGKKNIDKQLGETLNEVTNC